MAAVPNAGSNQTLAHALQSPETGFGFDHYFARFIASVCTHDTELVYQCSLLLCTALRQGHTCLNLSNVNLINSLAAAVSLPPLLHTPEELKTRLLTQAAVGSPGAYRPLIFDGSRLYLYRYWRYEHDLATSLVCRARLSTNATSPPVANEKIDLQEMAIFGATSRQLTILTGGPGTGKTRTIAQMLIALLQATPAHLRIALAAPTGKAAARLIDTLNDAVASLNLPTNLSASLPRESFTLHRLLGTIPYSPRFKHHELQQLPFDVIIIDEVSMVDTALMAKLVAAIPLRCKLILVGDSDQLPSIEAGSVFADMCSTEPPVSCTVAEPGVDNELETVHPLPTPTDPLAPCRVNLIKNYRFLENSGILAVSQAIRTGNSIGALTLLKDPAYTDCHWIELPHAEALRSTLTERIYAFATTLNAIKDPQKALLYSNRLRILCALREGPWGINACNETVQQMFGNKKRQATQPDYYAGMPIMITANSYPLNLYNGDTGILLPDPVSPHTLVAYFSLGGGSLQQFPLVRLPTFTCAYAMTIHKSQGSEFDEVVVVLPPVTSPLLTRELLYTAFTRARKKIELWSPRAVLEQTIKTKDERMTGLHNCLHQQCAIQANNVTR